MGVSGTDGNLRSDGKEVPDAEDPMGRRRSRGQAEHPKGVHQGRDRGSVPVQGAFRVPRPGRERAAPSEHRPRGPDLRRRRLPGRAQGTDAREAPRGGLSLQRDTPSSYEGRVRRKVAAPDLRSFLRTAVTLYGAASGPVVVRRPLTGRGSRRCGGIVATLALLKRSVAA